MSQYQTDESPSPSTFCDDEEYDTAGEGDGIYDPPSATTSGASSPVLGVDTNGGADSVVASVTGHGNCISSQTSPRVPLDIFKLWRRYRGFKEAIERGAIQIDSITAYLVQPCEKTKAAEGRAPAKQHRRLTRKEVVALGTYRDLDLKKLGVAFSAAVTEGTQRSHKTTVTWVNRDVTVWHQLSETSKHPLARDKVDDVASGLGVYSWLAMAEDGIEALYHALIAGHGTAVLSVDAFTPTDELYKAAMAAAKNSACRSCDQVRHFYRLLPDWAGAGMLYLAWR